MNFFMMFLAAHMVVRNELAGTQGRLPRPHPHTHRDLVVESDATAILYVTVKVKGSQLITV